MADRPRKALILARGGRRLSRTQRQILERLEQALPEATHLQIWTELEIFDVDGTVHELDAIALGHYGLYVLEVKDVSGRLVGDDRTWTVETAGQPPRAMDNPLPVVCANARLLERYFDREIARPGIHVDPLILLSTDNAEIELPVPVRRDVVTTGELLRRLQSGEKDDDEGPARFRLPVSTETVREVTEVLSGLRRRIRPGYGNLQQELSVLHRDLVADLADVMAKDPSSATPSLGGRANALRLRLEEVAAAWVIACVFVRALEALGYIERWLAGEGAEARKRAFLAEGPSRTPRDYLMHLLSEIGQYPACKQILGQAEHALWKIAPSDEGADALLAFFREGDGRDRELLDERLWGDLYERISEPLRSANAFVQTPAMVEDLLLNRTLDPAIAELGVSRVNVIDPACGAGALLVGAFRRLLAGRSASPSSHHALAVLEQVHGADISPAAIMITRIRLLLAYCATTRCERISNVPALPLHVVAADSLLAPGEPLARSLDLWAFSPPGNVLLWRYSVVVCAPPLTTAGEPSLREAYRERYRSAVQKYPLFSPFIERCFQLAEPGGFVGMLVGNSFMKRQFGKPLVEEVLPTVELTHVIDTSGAYIPGYGMPTVMLLGRNRSPSSETVRVVVGKRGEPITPMLPAEGRVWSSIVTHLDQVGYEDGYIAVSDMPREVLVKHPWTLGAPDVIALGENLERRSVQLRDLGASFHMGARSRLDQVYMLPERVAARLGLESEVLRPLVHGAVIRDYSFLAEEVALVPPEHAVPRPTDQHLRWWAWLQRYRPLLVHRWPSAALANFSWWAWPQAPAAADPRMRIIGPAVARNNHFALAPGDLVASRTVLVIEPDGATSETELYSWLAFLNSSTAAFWMKLGAPSKGTANVGARPEEPVYELLGVRDKALIPRAIFEPGALRDELVALARQLERTAHELGATAPEQVIDRWDRASREGLADALGDAQLRERTLLRRMVCEQEDLDWLVYEAIGLTNGEGHIPKASASPEQRPFAWLTDEPPVGLDRRLTESWRRRRQAKQAHGPLQILESAPYKRSFRDVEDGGGVELDEPREELDPDLDAHLPARERRVSTDYARRTALACECWLLDRLEESFRGAPPRCASVQELVSRLYTIAGVPSVVAVLAQERRAVTTAVLERRVCELLGGHVVPYLAALRHTEPGLDKRAQWEEAWASSRRQDAGAPVSSAPPPPLYSRSDYRDASVFGHRGKLDIPTERFIVYPDDGGVQPRYGWAGWTPVQQAEALVVLMEQRQAEGMGAEHLIPLLAGIQELVSWMPSWDGTAPEAGSAAETFQVRVRNEAGRLGLAVETLRRLAGQERREQSKEIPPS